MSGSDRVDEVIRIIDRVLGPEAERGALASTDFEGASGRHVGSPSAHDDANEPEDEPSDERDLEEAVEAVPGNWGVFYFRPSAF